MSEPLKLALQGRLDALDGDTRARYLKRAYEPAPEVAAAVAGIIDEVGRRGDEALRSLAQRYDGVVLDNLEVSTSARRAALRRCPGDVIAALETARDRIAAFHSRQLPVADEAEVGRGIRVGRRPEPLRTVGAYAPGGRAAYPSSVLMCVVPARIAGVDEIVVCSPPRPEAPETAPADVVLAACELAGVDRVFAVGGAGAVAALAYGTDTLPRADKVVGPGNAYVTEAKRQLAGRIASDCLAGPSELLVIADSGADPEVIAREMVAQAEHDPSAIVIAVVTDKRLVTSTLQAVERRAADADRADIVHQALANSGGLLLAGSRDEALSFATAFAPEHLLLLTEDPRQDMARVRGAGSIFLGPGSSVTFGDYLSGTNHVLPTGGQGRSESGLSVADFVRWSSWQQIDTVGAASLAAPTEIIATAEGLPGHAAAARAQRGEIDPRAARHDTLRPRADYRQLTTYDPGRAPVEIDLTDNTNLFGQAPAAVRVLESLDAARARRYPSLYGGELKRAAASYFGVAEESVATGCGSDDLLDSTIRAFCSGADGVAFARPTFSMIEAFCRMNGARPVGVDLGRGFELDVDRLAAASARVTYVCRPNNPTANACDRAAIEDLVRRASGLVIIDEAYGDFCADPLAAWAPQTHRAVVLRTLSKAFGLAGLRVGIAIGPPAIIDEIEKSRGPYKVSVVSEAAAAAALDADADWVAATVAEAIAARRRLTDSLGKLGLQVFPSDANFLLVAAPDNDAAAFARALAERSIGVRPFAGLPGAGDCVRITVGPQPLMQRLVGAIEEIVR